MIYLMSDRGLKARDMLNVGFDSMSLGRFFRMHLAGVVSYQDHFHA